jgi:glycine C-acetyltransferase
MDRIDIFTSTLGKALGGGSGGFTASRREVVDLLRQRSRPYLFSNTLAPPLVAAGLQALDLISRSAELRTRLRDNTLYLRKRLTEAGFDIKPGEHPIIPIMLYEAPLAQRMAAELLTRGIYVIGFSYPVVPQGQARIRVQVTAAHTRAHLDRAADALITIGRALHVIT